MIWLLFHLRHVSGVAVLHIVPFHMTSFVIGVDGGLYQMIVLDCKSLHINRILK